MKEIMNILLTEIFIINPFELIINIKFLSAVELSAFIQV